MKTARKTPRRVSSSRRGCLRLYLSQAPVADLEVSRLAPRMIDQEPYPRLDGSADLAVSFNAPLARPPGRSHQSRLGGQDVATCPGEIPLANRSPLIRI
jgi:hypothetical protein